MKKTMKILALGLAAAMAFASCGKEENEPFVQPDEEIDFTGTMTVTYEGEAYPSENIVIEVDFDDDGNTADIKFNKVKFVPQMPITIDVTVPDVPYTTSSDGKTVNFKAASIVPLMMGGTEYPAYTATGINGEFKSTGTLELSLSFGEYPVIYSGTRL